ncbi:MAG: hypothetical protein N2260_07980 [Syntrophobacterales bacterium]|nr:hypothetical protein [Syntrophobacterales bacterium]
MLVWFEGNRIENWQVEVYSSKPFGRRVKRMVKAPKHIFEVIVPPQWKKVCKEEIEALGYQVLNNQSDASPLKDPLSNGILVEGRIWDGYKLCLWLRTASRVIVHIARFGARSIEAFRKKMGSIPWEVWLNPTLPLRLYCNLDRSALRHEGLVCKETVEALCRRFNEQGLKLFPKFVKDNEGDSKCRLWINVSQDLCIVKIDLTGAHLHEREYRLEPGEAPLRETLAAAMLKLLRWDRLKTPLIDAMTGSGTIAIEAGLMARNRAPGIKRSFLFERLPFFNEAAWRYEKRLAEDSIENPSQPIFAIDEDIEQLERAKRNATRAGVMEDIRWIQGDFFSFTPKRLGIPVAGKLLINPPYGKRLSVPVRSFYNRLKEHLRNYWHDWTVGLLVPNRDLLPLFSDFKPAVLRLPHGGLWVNFVMFGKDL